MTNWARWKSGVSIGVAVSSAFDLEARGRREAASIPLLNGEASDVDSAVDALPRELHDVVIEHWLKKGTVEKHARSCRCGVTTYYQRLSHAHERIRALMRGKRDQAERARALYRARGSLVKTPAE
jgi:DNA-directed RNA polymerase specialized sigma24 family protein